MDKLLKFLRTLKSSHHRIMMRYLRKRGWVVFYLEEQYRKQCKNNECWLNLYYAEQKQKRSRVVKRQAKKNVNNVRR